MYIHTHIHTHTHTHTLRHILYKHILCVYIIYIYYIDIYTHTHTHLLQHKRIVDIENGGVELSQRLRALIHQQIPVGSVGPIPIVVQCLSLVVEYVVEYLSLVVEYVVEYLSLVVEYL